MVEHRKVAVAVKKSAFEAGVVALLPWVGSAIVFVAVVRFISAGGFMLLVEAWVALWALFFLVCSNRKKPAVTAPDSEEDVARMERSGNPGA